MNEKSYNLCLNNDTHIGTIFGTDYKVDEDNYDLGEGVEAIKYFTIYYNETSVYRMVCKNIEVIKLEPEADMIIERESYKVIFEKL